MQFDIYFGKFSFVDFNLPEHREEIIMDTETAIKSSNLSGPVDILNREKFVDQIFKLLETLSEANSACTLALNGRWGSGKSFVLTLLERQLREYQGGEKYLVFHYNCWQYDYYEEPLLSIVTAMYNDIDEQIHLFSPEHRERWAKGLSAARPMLQKMLVSVAENKIGIDLDLILELLSKTEDAQADFLKKTKDQHEYDLFDGFKKVLEEVKNQLHKLASDYAIVVIVDELDRCLPDYSVKVLERLHHLFSDIERTTVILAIDRIQLNYTIESIFGANCDIEAYLKKFINLEMTLDIGIINSNFREKYRDFFTLFDETLLYTQIPLDDYFSALFEYIPIRAQERLMEKVITIHRLLFKNVKKDYSFMCFELLMAVFHEKSITGLPFRIEYDRGSNNVICNKGFSDKLSAFVKNNCCYRGMSTTSKGSAAGIRFDTPTDILELMIYYSYNVYSNVADNYYLGKSATRKEELESYIDDFKKIRQMLGILN